VGIQLSLYGLVPTFPVSVNQELTEAVYFGAGTSDLLQRGHSGRVSVLLHSIDEEAPSIAR